LSPSRIPTSLVEPYTNYVGLGVSTS
jgi:hypothetical protein